MPADVQKTKCQFLKRKMLIGLSGKYNFIFELFIYTGEMLHSRLDFMFMEGDPLI